MNIYAKVKKNAAICSDPNESGVIIVLFALLLAGLLTIVMFTVGLGDWTFRRTELQLAADTAASDAAASFCSTRSCWNYSLINALESLDRMGVRGVTNSARFRTELQAAIADLKSQLANGVKDISGANGQNEWLIDGLKVQISRGRWWPEGVQKTVYDSNGVGTVVPVAPASVDVSRLIPQNDIYGFTDSVGFEPKFEPFDRFDGTVWQAEAGNQGTPAFIAANSVHVKFSFEKYSPILYLGVPSGASTIAVESVAARLKQSPKLEFCAAPFAIPVCTLLNNLGEYVPESACKFDRFFTGEKRYCTQTELDAGTCNVLPGSFYAPITDQSCDSSKPWYSEARCECAQTAQDPCIPGQFCPEPWVRGLSKPRSSFNGAVEGVPCGQHFGQNSTHCSFNPWPKLTQVSDHYGVVGTSTTDIYSYDPRSENTYRWIMSSRLCVRQTFQSDGSSRLEKVPNTVKMRIGERFEIKPDGLVEPETDQYVWDAIWGEMPLGSRDYPQKHMIHPKLFDPTNTYFGLNGFRELGYPWFIGRANDATGFPVGATKSFLDEIIDLGYVKPYDNYGQVDAATGNDRQAVEPYQCAKDGTPQFGVCNSHRVMYNNQCHRKHRWFNPRDSNAQCLLDAPYSQSLWTDPKGYCHPDGPSFDPYIQSEQIRVGATDFWQQWNHTFTLSPGDEWSCQTAPPYMPCPVVEVGTYPRGGENSPPRFYDRNSDFHPSEIRVWQTHIPIIANVSPTATPCTGVNGHTGPDPQIDHTDEWRIIGFIRNNFFDNDIGKPPPKPPGAAYNTNSGGYEDIRVCEYDSDNDGNGVPDRYPWGFNPTFKAAPMNDPSGAPVEMGAEQNCNMVRGRVACDPGLVAGDFSGLFAEYQAPPAIVFTR